MRSFLFAFLLLLFPARVGIAQTPPPEQIVTADMDVQKAIDEQLRTIAEGGRPEVLKTSNSLIYPYGIYQHVLSCTILRICIIELEPGEVIYAMGAGDHTRWRSDHGQTGVNGNTSYLTVVPTDNNLTTNLVISTDRRIYHLTLDSPPRRGRGTPKNPLDEYTRHIRFYYPTATIHVSSPAPEPEGQKVGQSIEDLNYNYSWRIENDFPWEPLAVFDDGSRVYVRVHDTVTSGGVLLLGSASDARSGSYIMEDGFLIIDRLFDEARIVLPGPTRRKGVFRRKRPSQKALIIQRD